MPIYTYLLYVAFFKATIANRGIIHGYMSQ